MSMKFMQVLMSAKLAIALNKMDFMTPTAKMTGKGNATYFAQEAMLPVGKFTRVDFEDQDPMCELSSIVVDPSVRSIGIIEHLYREGWADAVRMGANAITGLG